MADSAASTDRDLDSIRDARICARRAKASQTQLAELTQEACVERLRGSLPIMRIPSVIPSFTAWRVCMAIGQRIGPFEIERSANVPEPGDWYFARRAGLTGPDVAGHVLKVGRASTNFAGDYRGTIGRVRYWRASLDDDALEVLAHGGDAAGLEPELDWQSELPIGETRWPPPPVAGPIRLQAPRGAVRFANVWVAPLDPVDHADVIAGWDESSFARGEKRRFIWGI